MSASEYVYLPLQRVCRTTKRALCCQIHGVERWIPRSVIADPEDYPVGPLPQGTELAVLEWFADKEGLSP